MNKVLVPSLMILVFLAGILVGGAQPNQETMRGTVKDANTMPEEIQYWEIRPQEGASITIVGARNVPLIARLREAKDRRVLISVTRDESPVSSGQVEGSR